MNEKLETVEKGAILRIVNKINEGWLRQQYDEIGNCLADDVVIAPPGSGNRVKGRDAYVQSYRDYDAAAKTHEFVAEDPQIDILGDTAAVVCPFSITYEMNSKTYKERGRDILILARQGSEWRVVWRTMQSEPA
jgi:hypothetical protein